MPTFQQSLDSDPAQLMSLADSLVRAAIEITGVGARYGATVSGLGAAWQGEDYQGLARWAGLVEAYIGRSEVALIDSAVTLEANAARMIAAVAAMRETVRAAETAGYQVLPAPLVVLGAGQWNQIAAAGPSGQVLLAAHEARAAAFTAALVGMYTAFIAYDTAANGVIRTALGV
ncbi:hypothetical protein [Glycomyces buryatensis]|uniref:Uncharacterized protein n=1 Tax=Glycomyces buryatensis TaxID=2570927 RepID=A0A4S8QCW8_9ACTN|nr:hypothetical protein [Glycomyces buryatensis]THV41431.1 hypothetical protein FAB82_11575 [Glycomyces buryatensis]